MAGLVRDCAAADKENRGYFLVVYQGRGFSLVVISGVEIPREGPMGGCHGKQSTKTKAKRKRNNAPAPMLMTLAFLLPIDFHYLLCFLPFSLNNTTARRLHSPRLNRYAYIS
jgi:hypothetical protein